MSHSAGHHLVLGITGRAHSGKDTAALHLKGLLEAEGYDVHILGFSYPIKDIACKVFSLTSWHVNTEEGKASKPDNCYGFTVRELLQKIGTEMFRDLVHQDVWIDLMWDTIHSKKLINPHRNKAFLIPDTRFDNEVTCLRDFGGTVIGVVRPGDSSSADNGHVSEAGISTEPDHLLVNDGSLGEFLTKVYELAKVIA